MWNGKNEIWKDIPGWESFYMVSTFGRVKSLERDVPDKRHGKKHLVEKILKPGIGTTGYLIVAFCRNGKAITKVVHCLVCLAFLGPVPEGKEVSHLDDNRLNPRLDNLLYETHQENIDRAKGWQDGEKNYSSKLSAVDIIDIRKLFSEGKSGSSISRLYNVSTATTSRIKNRKTWKHLKGGIAC